MKQLLITLLLFIAIMSACKAQLVSISSQNGLPGGGGSTLAECCTKAIKDYGNIVVRCETSECLRLAYKLFVMDMKICRILYGDEDNISETSVTPIPCHVAAVARVIDKLEMCTTKSCVQQYLKVIQEDIIKCK